MDALAHSRREARRDLAAWGLTGLGGGLLLVWFFRQSGALATPGLGLTGVAVIGALFGALLAPVLLPLGRLAARLFIR
ncbi:MAG: hypothetical protein AB1578_20980 [Thermodesulfobacteriota bacterium]